MMKRRRFLALGAAAGGMAAVGAALFSNGYRSWVVSVLERALPGYSYDPAGLDLFVEERASSHTSALKFRLLGAAESVVDAKWIMPRRVVHYIEDEERGVLTDFLIGSDFFQQAPYGGRTITYNGRRTACVSPFATFDLQGLL
jgi:hypothetical protein